MDLSNLGLVFALAGVVELVKRAWDKDFRTVSIIVVSAVAGAVLAPFAGDISWFNGLLYGLSASGVITTLSHIG